MKKGLIFIFLVVLLTSLVYSEVPKQNKDYDCSKEIKEYLINISILKQNISTLMGEVEYYKNLSEYYKNLSMYYKDLYESKEINVTNRELIQIFNTFNEYNSFFAQINQSLYEIKNKFTIFSIEVGLSIIGLTGISVGIIELIIHWKRRKNKIKDNNENEKEIK